MLRVFPTPPVELLKHGQAWEVVLEPAVVRRAARSWDEAWAGPPAPRSHLVLITAPYKGWPTNEAWAGWWRSRLVVGDLSLRSQEAILVDFRRLLLQTPPVLRNWRRNLAWGRQNKLQWHLIWVRTLGVLI